MRKDMVPDCSILGTKIHVTHNLADTTDQIDLFISQISLCEAHTLVSHWLTKCSLD